MQESPETAVGASEHKVRNTSKLPLLTLLYPVWPQKIKLEGVPCVPLQGGSERDQHAWTGDIETMHPWPGGKQPSEQLTTKPMLLTTPRIGRMRQMLSEGHACTMNFLSLHMTKSIPRLWEKKRVIWERKVWQNYTHVFCADLSKMLGNLHIIDHGLYFLKL